MVSVTGPTSGCAFGNLFVIKVDMLSIKKEAMNIQVLSTMYLYSQLLESGQLFSSLLSKIFILFAHFSGLFYFLVVL